MRLKKLINLNKKKSLYLLDKYQKINFLIAIRYVNHQTKLKCKLKKSKINENIHLNKTKQKKKPPISVVCPATSSDSASPRSKGIRPVSRKKIINKNGKIGNKSKKLHVQLC